MKTNLFDLTGQECFCCAESRGTDNIQEIKAVHLHSLLIYPRNPDSNKSPYLQNPTMPTIEDFYTEDCRFDFSKSVFLSEMLAGDIDDRKRDHLRNFFNYQLGILSDFNNSNFNIILVPDHYAPEKQEKLLRCCGLPRSNTLLLWRSVAICLGAEENLLAAGVKEGDRIAIVDTQTSGSVNISILTMRSDDGQLVPARSSFNKKEKYPVVDGETRYLNPSVSSEYWMESINKAREFWSRTWQRDGEFYVPLGDSWTKRKFKKYHRQYLDVLPSSLKDEIDFYVIAGNTEIVFLNDIAPSKIIYERSKNNFSLLGAGRFSIRNANGLPTYFDECESLYFIIQDLNEERIISKELIKGNEFCRGGKEISGDVNRDFVLGKDNNSVSFLMHVGEINSNTPLRELTQEFRRSAVTDQPLALFPSMIPGQGIACVIVDASPLLRDKVELDFLKMSMAIDTENGNKPKTMKYLQENLPRSYPVDFPEAEASYSLWKRYCDIFVRYFMNENSFLDSDCFAHTTWPNSGCGGIEALKRVNVFGTKEGMEYPIKDLKYIHQVFMKIAEQYEKYQSDDYIRLAAWTYRCGIKEFQDIVNQVLTKVKEKALGKMVSLKKVEFTVCANMLSLDEQESFFQSFNEYVSPKVKGIRDNQQRTAISGVDEWIRALMWILIYSNELLKNISTRDCKDCMYILYLILKNYIQHKTNYTQSRYIRNVIYCMLFLLRRRKYDHDFLREETTPIYGKIMSLKQIIDSSLNGSSCSNVGIANAFFEYLENKGRLDIPMGGILNDRD